MWCLIVSIPDLCPLSYIVLSHSTHNSKHCLKEVASNRHLLYLTVLVGFAHGHVIEVFQCHVMTQNDTRLNNLIGLITLNPETLGKQVRTQNDKSVLDMNATYWKIMLNAILSI